MIINSILRIHFFLIPLAIFGGCKNPAEDVRYEVPRQEENLKDRPHIVDSFRPDRPLKNLETTPQFKDSLLVNDIDSSQKRISKDRAHGK